MSDIFVDDKGEGFPFVLVHGYLGSSEMWCFQKKYFFPENIARELSNVLFPSFIALKLASIE